MDISKSLDEMKELQNLILEILEGDDYDSNYDSLIKKLSANSQYQKDDQKFKSLLLLIIKISKNHHRCPDFIHKICQILLLFKNQIKQTFSNDDIFNYFKGNKRILLFLLEEGIFQINESIASKMIDGKFSKYKFKEYFWPELKPYIEKVESDQINEEISDDFENKRHVGENDSYVCELIRKDLVEDFISYVNRTNLSLETEISPSIFETNHFLLKNKPTLIEYSAFFGSIQIFNYLNLNQVKLNPSLWLYVIHGKNSDLIHFLEENEVNKRPNYYEQCIEESIKCHHNDIATYIKDNVVLDQYRYTLENNYFKNIYAYSFHYHNYNFFPETIDMKCNFYYACKYNYLDIVEYFVKENNIDINMPIILIRI